MSKNFAMPYSGSLCITDCLSHTTHVETNKGFNLPVCTEFRYPNSMEISLFEEGIVGYSCGLMINGIYVQILHNCFNFFFFSNQ